MHFLIFLILYEELNNKGESINFNGLLYSNKIKEKELKDFLISKKTFNRNSGQSSRKALN